MKDLYKIILDQITEKKIPKEDGVKIISKLVNNKSLFDDIAVIGMSCKVAGLGNTQEFWDALESNTHPFSEYPKERQNDCLNYLRNINEYPKVYKDGNIPFLKGGFFKTVAEFDHNFFELSENQAIYMDPNHRLTCEVIYHAMEDAGYGGDRLKDSNTGIFWGYANSPLGGYSHQIQSLKKQGIMQLALAGNVAAIIPSRISYLFNFNGPSMVIDTACSSSLVAIHTACNSIKKGDCTQAIAGGIKLHLDVVDSNDRKIGIESYDGITRTFDEKAKGIGLSEGVGAVVLKPLKSAIEDGDRIYAIIKGSAVNQDGKSSSVTSPSPKAQTEVIVDAWRKASIDPETITYFETHGTGTQIGDPIEVESIQNAFREFTNKESFCDLGAIKTHLGHSFEASGVVSFISVINAMKNSKIPGILNFNKINPKINLNNSPIKISSELKEWNPHCGIKRAGINAFGLSGTNCHILIEDYESVKNVETENEYDKHEILTLSAKSKKSLMGIVRSYAYYLKQTENSLADICYSQAISRGHYSHRFAVDGQNKEEILTKLNMIIDNNLHCQTNSDNKLINEYLSGIDINWLTFYENRNLKIVDIPLYVYDKKRCWVDIPDFVSQEQGVIDNVLFKTYWKKKSQISLSQLNNDKFLVFGNLMGLTSELNLNNSIKVDFIDENEEGYFKKESDYHYVISHSYNSYIKLFNEGILNNINKIIFMPEVKDSFKVSDIDSINNSLDSSFFSLHYMVKALLTHYTETDIEVIVLTNQAYAVEDKENLNCNSTPLAAFTRCIMRETKHLKCRIVDIDKSINGNLLYRELISNYSCIPVAYRNGIRYIETFDSLDINNKVKYDNNTIRENGVYIITGGLGAIGLSIAKYLSQIKNVNIILFNRSSFPEREAWDDIILRNDNRKLLHKIKQIKEVESNGSTIVCLKADVGKEKDVNNVINNIRAKFGVISGIFHCAGVAGSGIIIQSEKEKIKSVLEPKVNGTILLHNATINDNLDFMMLFSSVASVFPAPCQSDYASANSFLDTFAVWRSRLGKKTISINWVAWKEIGMAVDYKVNIDTAFKAIETNKALKVLDIALRSQETNIFAGAINYKSEYADIILSHTPKLSETILKNIEVYSIKQKDQDSEKSINKNIIISGRENQKYTNTEKIIVNIWGAELGCKEININQNYYEIGGDSISAMMILNKMSKEFNTNFSIAKALEILDELSIKELAAYIDSTSNIQHEESVITV